MFLHPRAVHVEALCTFVQDSGVGHIRSIKETLTTTVWPQEMRYSPFLRGQHQIKALYSKMVPVAFFFCVSSFSGFHRSHVTQVDTMGGQAAGPANRVGAIDSRLRRAVATRKNTSIRPVYVFYNYHRLRILYRLYGCTDDDASLA